MLDAGPDPQAELADLQYHLLWPTRRRRPFLDGAILDRTAELFAEAAESIGARIKRIASGRDFVIITVDAPPDVSPLLIANRLKRHSAGNLRREFRELQTLPSIWTRQLLATTRDDLPPERIRDFLESQPRSERRRYPSLAELSDRPAHRTAIDVVLLPPLQQPDHMEDAIS